MATATAANGTAIGESPTNDASQIIVTGEPYIVQVTIEGVSAILFHRWSDEAVEAKSKAAKGSAAKKTDDVENYVYRDENGFICLPGAYLKGCIAGPQGAAKYRQDPRSPRKSALDLYKAGLHVLTELSNLGKAEWDYLDKRRVTVQRQGITRTRPAFLAGWRATFDLSVVTPEYISPTDLLDVLTNAGRLVGVGDFRPTYGRFQVVEFKQIDLEA